jgi:hypothetical protein
VHAAVHQRNTDLVFEITKAIDEEAAKCRDEDWSLMVGYVQACLEKLPGELEEWQKD